MHHLSKLGLLALALTTIACLDASDASRSSLAGEGEETGTGEFDRDDCKIEGSQIGREGGELQLGGTTVTFHDWVTKHGEPNEYVGFSITVRGASGISYVVKAGGELHPASSATWLHPAGVDGADQAPAISNVDFCEQCDDGGCDPSPDPEPTPDPSPDDPGCTNPDGCPDPDSGDGPVL